MIAAYFLRAPHDEVERDGAIMRFYTRLVRTSVRHRWITLFAGALIFAASLWSTRLLPSGFIPPDDYGRALLAIELPPGSRLDDTDRITRAISEKLRAMPEVRSALIFGGKLLGGTDDEPRKATIIINLVHKSKREASQQDMQLKIGALLADQPDIRFWFLKDNGQRDLQLIIAGPDINVINDTANQIASEMRSIPTIENPISTAELERPELRIVPKPQVAAEGLSGILCAGPVARSRLNEPFVEHDGELGLCLEPFARRHFPLSRGLAQDQKQQFRRGVVSWENDRAILTARRNLAFSASMALVV